MTHQEQIDNFYQSGDITQFFNIPEQYRSQVILHSLRGLKNKSLFTKDDLPLDVIESVLTEQVGLIRFGWFDLSLDLFTLLNSHVLITIFNSTNHVLTRMFINNQKLNTIHQSILNAVNNYNVFHLSKNDNTIPIKTENLTFKIELLE